MVNVSKKYPGKELQTKAWSVFLHEVKKSDSSESLLKNLKNFLTTSEITMLEKRLSIPLLIERGMSYRDIGRVLDVSSTTISFVKHSLVKRPTVHRVVTVRKDPKKKFPSSRYAGNPNLF